MEERKRKERKKGKERRIRGKVEEGVLRSVGTSHLESVQWSQIGSSRLRRCDEDVMKLKWMW